MQNIDWEDLRYFLAVVREGSLSGAARVLSVHASTVSRRLESLEATLGVTLFRRTTEGLATTDTALKLLDPGLSVERQMRLIAELASGESSQIGGRVRLSITTTFDQHFLSPRIPLLLKRHPALRPHITSGSALVDLVAGDADVAVRFGPGNAIAPIPSTQESDLHARLLSPIATHVFGSRAYLERLGLGNKPRPQALDFIAPTSGMPGANWVEEHILPEKVVVQSDYYGGTLEMVTAGLGAAILPDFVAMRGDELICLEHLGKIATRSLWIIWPTDLRRVARVQAMVDFIVECVNEDPRIFDLAAPLDDSTDHPC